MSWQGPTTGSTTSWDDRELILGAGAWVPAPAHLNPLQESGCVSRAGGSPGCTYAERQVAIVRTSPGQQPFPAQSKSLDRGLQAPGLLSRRGDAIWGCTSYFLLAAGLVMQGLDAPVSRDHCPGPPRGSPSGPRTALNQPTCGKGGGRGMQRAS